VDPSRPRTVISLPRTSCSRALSSSALLYSFFFNAPAPSDIYTLSLHDALPIFRRQQLDQAALPGQALAQGQPARRQRVAKPDQVDRKSTRLNSSHVAISYAVFCLKKKKQQKQTTTGP